MIARFVRGAEAGHTLIELTVTTALIGLMVSLMMPAFQGYRENSQVRTVAWEAITQMRQAQMTAEALDAQMNVLFDPTGDLPSRGDVQGWEICAPGASCSFSSTWSTSDPALMRTIVPNSVNMTAYCYRGAYTPTGTYLNWTGVCSSPGTSTEAMCFNSVGANPTKIYVTIQLATGGTTLSGLKSGTCP